MSAASNGPTRFQSRMNLRAAGLRPKPTKNMSVPALRASFPETSKTSAFGAGFEEKIREDDGRQGRFLGISVEPAQGTAGQSAAVSRRRLRIRMLPAAGALRKWSSTV